MSEREPFGEQTNHIPTDIENSLGLMLNNFRRLYHTRQAYILHQGEIVKEFLSCMGTSLTAEGCGTNEGPEKSIM